MCLDLNNDPLAIIRQFGMKPHPEGGWYAEMFQAGNKAGERSAVSAIYFLLRAGECSHWHTLDATEIWLWHAGAPITLHLSQDGAVRETCLLGANLAAGERPQVVVAEGVWQSAESAGEWSLVSCVVAPAFHFGGFKLAAAGWEPGAGSVQEV